MYWLNLLVTLLLGLGLLALLALAAADLLGLLPGPRWRVSGGLDRRAPLPGASAIPPLLPEEPALEEPPPAWICYARGGKVAQRQPLPAEGSAFIGRQAYPELERAVAFRAVEVAWNDGAPSLRNLDPACPLELRLPGEAEPLCLQAGSDWESWPEGATLALGGFTLTWQAREEEA